MLIKIKIKAINKLYPPHTFLQGSHTDKVYCIP